MRSAHAPASEDLERAARLIELALPAMDRSRRSATWLGWVQALPDQLVRARPVLSVGYAWALLAGRELEAAEARLQDAERWLDTTAAAAERPAAGAAEMALAEDEELRALPATIASARAYRAQALGDVPATVEHARRALELLPEDDHLRRGSPAALLTMVS